MKNLVILIAAFIGFSLTSIAQVYKFKSTETDIEVPGKEVRTEYEICYHTFDFDNKKVIYEGTNSKGEKIRTTHPMKSSYQEGVTYVIVVNTNGISEIWFSPSMNNLGYDLMDGTRLACYDITNVN
jgi:hypothetical protein